MVVKRSDSLRPGRGRWWHFKLVDLRRLNATSNQKRGRQWATCLASTSDAQPSSQNDIPRAGKKAHAAMDG
jgi:hypothetical protein